MLFESDCLMKREKAVVRDVEILTELGLVIKFFVIEVALNYYLRANWFQFEVKFRRRRSYS